MEFLLISLEEIPLKWALTKEKVLNSTPAPWEMSPYFNQLSKKKAPFTR